MGVGDHVSENLRYRWGRYFEKFRDSFVWQLLEKTKGSVQENISCEISSSSLLVVYKLRERRVGSVSKSFGQSVQIEIFADEISDGLARAHLVFTGDVKSVRYG
jgi:hypothetical protein